MSENEMQNITDESETLEIQYKISAEESRLEHESANKDLKELMRTRPLCCELVWSLFVAAARSYRFSSILRPFPPMYKSGDDKDITALRNAISRIPPMKRSSGSFWASMSSDCQVLVAWVLSLGQIQLELKEKTKEFSLIKDLTGQVMDTPEPSYVFEVHPNTEAQQKFERLRAGRKLIYAYHGSRLDNFFSILHLGLNTHLNKVSVFGEGTYLSSELSVSLMYSQAGDSWHHSALGSRMACVAVCQMIDDPSVKCQVKEGSSATKKSRSQASKETDSVPEKYFVVQRNDVIRVKYLLIYKEKNAQPTITTTSRSISWLRNYKFPLLLLAYLLLLVAIGLSSSRSTVNAVSRFFKSFSK